MPSAWSFRNAQPLGGALQTLQQLGFGSKKEDAGENVAAAMMAVIAATPGRMPPALPQFHWKPDQRQ
jgi:hypothetical protein